MSMNEFLRANRGPAFASTSSVDSSGGGGQSEASAQQAQQQQNAMDAFGEQMDMQSKQEQVMASLEKDAINNITTW